MASKSRLELCTCYRLPPGVGPRANQGNMSGIQVDGLDSLPLGRGKFARFFQVRSKGVGEYEICKITDSNHGDLPLYPTH